MMKRMNMDDRLAATRFDSDDANAHIVIAVSYTHLTLPTT